jgi:hypothetical protein
MGRERCQYKTTSRNNTAKGEELRITKTKEDMRKTLRGGLKVINRYVFGTGIEPKGEESKELNR